MSNELQRIDPAARVALRAEEMSDLQRLGKLLAESGYFSDAREMAQAAVKVMAGQELGLPPIASMMGINIIKGKVALGAHLIASRVRAHGYDFRHVRFDSTGCVLAFYGRAGADGKRDSLGESSFTEEDAKAAGLLSDMYRKYPRNMYFSRAMSNGAKWYCPDVFGGAPVFTPEELGADVDQNGEMVQPEHRRGTQAAADAVAQRKIAEMQAAPVVAATENVEREDGSEPAPAPKFDFKVMLAAFAAMKEQIGEEAYYAELKSEGFAHANQIKSAVMARKVYKAMADIMRSSQAAETPAGEAA